AYGVIEYDANGYAVSFIEKPQPDQISSKYINAGTYIFEQKVLEEIPEERAVSIEKETFPLLLLKGHKIGVYKSSSYWIDIGTLDKYKQVHMDILYKKCKLDDYSFNEENIILGKNVQIHPTARIVGPSYIGDNVEIGAKTIISKSVIGNNTSIGSGCRIARSVLWEDVIISKEVRIINTIVTSKCFISKDLNYVNSVYSGNKEVV
ncbi:MAG TPA: NDP-sugar synthase, partial [Clostridia bacterium]|nr:NDP-sugar synthase [Clostridia bacterium]